MSFINLDGNETRMAGKARSFVDNLRGLRGIARDLKETADQAAAGNGGPDWAAFRTVFGFESNEDAEAFYNLLGSVNTTLQSDSFIAQLVSRMG